MGLLHKYREFGEYTDNIILNSSLYFAPIESFNDPFDCKLSYRQSYTKREIHKYLIKILERNLEQKVRLKDLKKEFRTSEKFIKFNEENTKKLISKIGVLSLSSIDSNILMWSHYAKSHEGLVFSFEPKRINNFDCLYHPIKVDYSSSYDELSYVEENKDEIIKLMLTKYQDWSYENEYRCVDIFYQGEKKFHKSELVSIKFGVKASTKNMDHIVNLCHKNGFKHVKFQQAVRNRGSFSLSFEEIC